MLRGCRGGHRSLQIHVCKVRRKRNLGLDVGLCVLSQGHGTWHVDVEKSTGRYKNFKAVGTETFGKLSPGQVFTDFERFAGIGTFDKHGDDEHGGNQ